jgi:hypothetical protein
MRCQLTNESAGSSWHFGWNQPFQLCWGLVDSSSSDQVANGIPTFTMFLFLLVTREILDFVCFQILHII